VNDPAVARRIRDLRPPKNHVDPYRAHGSIVEDERRPDGTLERALTIFLAGAECPFTCSFCDLWRGTIDGPTPAGALTKQIEGVVATLDDVRCERLKLYNSSNFFDHHAVPLSDVQGIAELTTPFSAVTVESHANTIGPAALEFAAKISGRLEIAVGLETIHPVAAAQLNKRLDLARFDRAARFLSENDIDLRVFVLLGAPHIPSRESVAWTVRTVEYAVDRGASVVSIIPVRGGNGEMERLQAEGEFAPPTLGQLEDALDRCAHIRCAVVTADLWDVERLPACDNCRKPKVERLRHFNLTGRPARAVVCDCSHRGTDISAPMATAGNQRV
jgi:archaeosine synthase beta-subunit